MITSLLSRASILAASAALAAACGQASTAAVQTEAAPQAITVAKVEQHDLRRTIDVVGTLAAVEEVTVSSEVEGRVLRIAADLVSLGEFVKTQTALCRSSRSIPSS